ncbi:MAG: DUF58 domain-containing protein [Verrucomicrobiales bacterium]|nr:DUF58 domain-containing protein [Verrucomicrobiales bacterium]
MAESIQRDFLDPVVLGRLMGLPLNSRHPMLGSVSGRHRSPVKGSALEFAQYRKYVPGDDTRRLDWRTWGRTDRYYIKEFEADTNLRLCFIVDTSGSMGYETGGINRLNYARSIAGTLAYLTVHQGDAAGLYAGAKSEDGSTFQEELPPKRGALHLGVMLDLIARLKSGGETALVESIHAAAEKIPQRAMIVIVSDLLFDLDPLQEAFDHLRFRKHDIALFHLLDREEIDFTFDRPTRFLDLEGGPSLLADPSLIQQKYREAVKDYLGKVDRIVNHSVVDYHRTFLDEPYDQVLARFLMGRNPKTARSAR